MIVRVIVDVHVISILVPDDTMVGKIVVWVVVGKSVIHVLKKQRNLELRERV